MSQQVGVGDQIVQNQTVQDSGLFFLSSWDISFRMDLRFCDYTYENWLVYVTYIQGSLQNLFSVLKISLATIVTIVLF